MLLAFTLPEFPNCENSELLVGLNGAGNKKEKNAAHRSSKPPTNKMKIMIIVWPFYFPFLELSLSSFTKQWHTYIVYMWLIITLWVKLKMINDRHRNKYRQTFVWFACRLLVGVTYQFYVSIARHYNELASVAFFLHTATILLWASWLDFLR